LAFHGLIFIEIFPASIASRLLLATAVRLLTLPDKIQRRSLMVSIFLPAGLVALA
jgi:hypothetical protein